MIGLGLLTARILIVFSLLLIIYAFLWGVSKIKVYKKLNDAEDNLETEEYIEYKSKVLRNNRKLLFISGIIIFLLPFLVGIGLLYLTYSQNL